MYLHGAAKQKKIAVHQGGERKKRNSESSRKKRELILCVDIRELLANVHEQHNEMVKLTLKKKKVLQVSKCWKNGAFFHRRNPGESDPRISISVCVIKALMTEELITSPGWVHAYLSELLQ